MIVDFETWFFFRSAVKAAEVSQKIELQFRVTLEERADSHNMLTRDHTRGFSQSVNNFAYPFRMLTQKRRRQGRRRCIFLTNRWLLVRFDVRPALFFHLTFSSGETQK